MKVICAAIVGFCMLFSLSLHAQELAATLSGTVTDATGAALPGAAITIAQVGVSGSQRIISTDSNGNYVVSNLNAGTYTVTVVSKGFETFKANNLVLNVAQKRGLDIKLKTGSVSETIVVEESNVALDTASSSQADTISGQQVRELELVDRNFQQLVLLQPGVVNIGLGDQPGFGLNSASGISVNGGRAGANNWSVDGADINDSGSNSTLLNIPSVDAIQEFTLERSNYDATFGRSGAGQIVVATRSGTSAFHGTAYMFYRTPGLDANSYFNKLTGGSRPSLHYYNYGFTIGGPAAIPHLYNSDKKKTFFFWSEEWRKVTSPATNNVPAPTTAELNGSFNATVAQYQATNAARPGCITSWSVYDTGNQLGSGTLDPSCYSANASVYLNKILKNFQANYIPSGQASPVAEGDYVSSFSSLQNFRQDLVRIDHHFNDKLVFFARGMEDDAPVNYPTGLWGGSNYPGVVNVAVNAPGKNVVGNLTWTISPTLVNEVEFAYSQGTIAGTLSGPANDSTILSSLTNNLAYKDPYNRIPSVGINDGSVTGISQGSAPYFERNLDRNLFDNFTWILGKHTLRAGVTVQQMLKTEDASEGNPSFNFDTWADFLLGNTTQYTQASRDIVPDLHYWNTEAYVQDDWKVSKKLVLNLGLRWSRFPSPTDVKNTLNNFDPDVYNAGNAPALDSSGNFVSGQDYTPATYANGLIFPKGAACSQAQAISPQVTCSPFGSTVNPNTSLNFGPRFGFSYSPYGSGHTVIRGGGGIFFDRTLNGIWEQNAFGDPPLVQTTTINNTTFDNPVGAGSAAPPNLGPNGLTTTGNPTFKVPSYIDYSLSLQQQLNYNTKLEIAYVGTAGRHLLGELDLNMPSLSTRASNDINTPLNNLRPYLGYSRFHTRLPIFTSNYSSLQVMLKHESKVLTLGVAYTWAKNLANQYNDRGVANTYTYQPNLDYGPSGLNQPQILIGNFVYKAPYFANQRGIVGRALGGWELSGIVSFESGMSFNVSQYPDPFQCNVDSDTGLCSSSTPANTYNGGLGIWNNGNYDILARPDASQSRPRMLKKGLNWFDTSIYSVAQGHFGNAGVGNILTPGYQNIDLGLMKNLKLYDSVKMQIRIESFNLFNHANFASVDSGLGDSSFGQITSTRDPRILQVSGKINF